MSEKKPIKSDYENEDIFAKQIAQDFFKSRNEIALMISEHDFKPKMSEKLTSMGVFFAGISTLRPVSVAYLIGACSKEDINNYMKYEKELVLLKTGSNYAGYQTYDQEGNEIHLEGVKVNVSFSVETPSYEDVMELARSKGHILQIPQEAINLAQELKRTATLFEVLKTNVAGFKISLEDELPKSHWDGFSDSETEYNILQNLILLHKSLPYEDENLNAFLNASIYARLRGNIADIKNYAEQHRENETLFLRMQYGFIFLMSLVPVLINADAEERKILLLGTIQKTREALKNYPDKEWGKYLTQWIDSSVDRFEDNLPMEYFLKEITLDKDTLNKTFLLSENEDVMALAPEIPAPKKAKRKQRRTQIKFSEDFAQLPREEQLVQLCQNYHHTVFNGIDFTIDHDMAERFKDLEKEMVDLDPIHKKLFKVYNLPEIYTYFMLGIVTKQQADDIAEITRGIFNERALVLLEREFSQHLFENNGFASEQIEEHYALYQEAQRTKDYSKLNVVQILMDLDVHPLEIDKLVPSVKETITLLMQHNFDENVRLSLRFKKEYFNLVEEVREAIKLILDNKSGADFLALHDVLPDSTCKVESKDMTRINRLTLINDIFQATFDDVPFTKEIIQARILLHQMIYASLQKSLKDLDNLPTNKNYTEITPQLKWMSRYISKNIPKSKVLEKEEENMAFLASMARYMLKKFTNSKSSRAYYLNWFDQSYGSTQQEDNAHLTMRLPVFRPNKYVIDSLNDAEKEEFLNELYEFYYSVEDQVANNHDKRVSYSVCSDVELLYAMGVLTPLEYSTALEKMESMLTEETLEKDVNIMVVCEALQKSNIPMYLPLNKKIMDTMHQIRLASEVLDSSYIYHNIESKSDVYHRSEGKITLYDMEKNPLKVEGEMLKIVLDIATDLPEMALESNDVVKKIVNSYWKQSAQQLNDLQLFFEKTHGDISQRISLQKSLFEIKDEEMVETVSNRLSNYPKLFHLIREGIMMKYENNYPKRNRALTYFEKIVEPFVAYYKQKQMDPNQKQNGGHER